MGSFEDWWVKAVKSVVASVPDEGDLRVALRSLAVMMHTSSLADFLAALKRFIDVASTWGLDEPSLREVLAWVEEKFGCEEEP